MNILYKQFPDWPLGVIGVGGFGLHAYSLTGSAWEGIKTALLMAGFVAGFFFLVVVPIVFVGTWLDNRRR
jgi:hypothetical protein